MNFSKNDNITIIPFDNVCIFNDFIYQDKDIINFDNFPFHALHWRNNKLEIEPTMEDENIILYDDEGYTYNGYIEKINKFVENKEQDAKFNYGFNDDIHISEEFRYYRDGYLKDTDWLVTRHIEQKTLNIPTSLTVEQYNNLLNYRQQLRDMTKLEGFPWADKESIPWPKNPIE